MLIVVHKDQIVPHVFIGLLPYNINKKLSLSFNYNCKDKLPGII